MLSITQKILEACKYTGSGIEKSLSASSVGNEVCQNWLKQKHGIIDDTKVGANTLGTILHLGMEQIFKDDGLVEHAMKRELDDYTITGTADLILDGCIYDYKFTKNYTLKKWREDKEGNTYTKQLNVLRWLSGDDLDMKLIFFLKDANDAKAEPHIVIEDVPVIDIEPVIQQAVNDLKSVLDQPPKCKDVWMRKINGVNKPSRCMFYCSYSDVCPHYLEPVTTPEW